MLHPAPINKKAGYILPLKKIGQIMALKARFCHLPKNQKESKKRDRQKSLHRASYVWMYFNELIHYVMEEEELTWNDDEWFPNEDL